ncbi:MAG: hypothetical protein QCH99_07685 [Candidatus Bathyarchaeota archaeon]|nr:hypothetical protein [Candidatus Bathyarchaeum tardum]
MDKKRNSHGLRKLASAKKESINRIFTGISLIAVIIIIVMLCLYPTGSLSASTPNFLETEQQFNLDVTYAYAGKGIPNATVTDSKGVLLHPLSQYPSAVYFNVTRPTVEDVLCDAILEVFKVTIVSDKGPAENFVFFTGTNCNPSFADVELNALTRGIYDLFDENSIDGVSGLFCFNWTDDESFLSAKVGSFGTYTNYKNGLGLWSAGKPNTISVKFHRIGRVTMTNRAISVQLDAISANNKTQVQLQEYNDGFLKNELLPMNELTQNTWFQPLKKQS